MSSLHIHAGADIAPAWIDQDDVVGLDETVADRVTQMFRLLIALNMIDAASADRSRSNQRIEILGEMTDLLGGQLVIMRRQLDEERQRSRSLEALLRQLVQPHRTGWS